MDSQVNHRLRMLIVVFMICSCSPMAAIAWQTTGGEIPSAPPTAQQSNDTEPASSELQQLLAQRKKLLDQFNSQSSRTSEQQLELVQQIVAIEKRAYEEFADSSELSVDEAKSLKEQFRNDGFFLVGLQEKTHNHQAVADTRHYLLSLTRDLFGDEHLKSIEAQIELDQVQWLAKADESQLQTWQSSREKFRLGNQAIGEQRWSDGVEQLNESKALLESLNLQVTLAYGETVANLAEAYKGAKDFENAIPTFELALELNDRLLQKKSSTNVSMRVSFGQVFQATGDGKRLEQLLDEASEIFSDAGPATRLQDAVLIHNIADQFSRIDQRQKAIAAFEDCFRLTARLAEQNLTLALQVLNSLHSQFSQLGAYANAAVVRRQMIGLIGNRPDADQATLAQWWIDAATAESKAGNKDKAKQGLTAADAIITRLEKGDPSEAVVRLIKSYAQALFGIGEIDPALEQIQLSVEMAKKLKGTEDMLYLSCLQNQAVLLGRAQRYQRAEDLMAELIPILEKQLGEEHREFHLILRDRAFFLQADKRWSDAAKVWQQLVELLEATKSTDDWLYADATKNRKLVAEQSGQGAAKEAFPEQRANSHQSP